MIKCCQFLFGNSKTWNMLIENLYRWISICGMKNSNAIHSTHMWNVYAFFVAKIWACATTTFSNHGSSGTAVQHLLATSDISNAWHALFHRNSFVGLYLHGWFFVDNDLKSGLSPIFIFRTRNNVSVPMVYFAKLFVVFEFERVCVRAEMNQEMIFFFFLQCNKSFHLMIGLIWFYNSLGFRFNSIEENQHIHLNDI